MFKRKRNRFYSRDKRNNKTLDTNSIHHVVYDDKDVAVILKNTPLPMVIGDYIALRRKGSLHVGRCPFCRDLGNNDWHFAVSTKKRRFKCFLCGIGGKHATGFLKLYHKIPFSKAISFLNWYYHKSKFELKKIKDI